jgi:hypothetical protein
VLDVEPHDFAAGLKFFSNICDYRSLRIPHHAFREASIEGLRKTDLEWTQVHNGLFLDYYGMPHVKTYLSPLVFAVDMVNKMAAIPGSTGNEAISLTDTKDLGKFVAATLDLPKWDQALHCYSENITFNELVHIAEENTGKYHASVE